MSVLYKLERASSDIKMVEEDFRGGLDMLESALVLLKMARSKIDFEALEEPEDVGNHRTFPNLNVLGDPDDQRLFHLLCMKYGQTKMQGVLYHWGVIHS